MSSSALEPRSVEAQSVKFTEDSLVVDLVDGRTISVPISWYPRLVYGTPQERAEWELIGRGSGIHWPKLDEDVSIDGILAGNPSKESRASLQKWLRNASRRVNRPGTIPAFGGR
ncbi:MAG: DUF2442 domain-containing protein [Actinobacteria bacterium]|nr:DUF2442 domain-containing protein [Actinomycetota bacterium]